MKKLTVFAHADDTESILQKMIALKCVEIETSDTEDIKEILPLVRINCDQQRSELETSISRISDAISVLDKYTHRKKGLFNKKINVKKDKFVADGYADKARFTVRSANEATTRQNEIKNEIHRLSALMSAATPWEAYDLPLGLAQTDCTEIALGTLPVGSDVNVLGKELYKAGALAEQVSSDMTSLYVALVFHKDDSAAVLKIMSEYGFTRLSFNDVDKPAKEYITQLRKNIQALEREYEAINNKLTALADHLASVEVLYDIDQTSLTAILNKQKLVSSASVALINAWIPAKAENKVVSALDAFDCAYEISLPTEEDNPPILLQNNAFARNFEWVLGMYSYPAYGKFDPTFIMSIFYFILFGIMFADAGYGLILSVVCFLAVKLMHPGEGTKRFLLMFGYCGIACIIGGVLFGAYFGDLPIAFMKNMLGMAESEIPNLALLGASAPTLALLFDPLQNPMAFLIMSLGLGAIHLITGMAIKFVILCREGHPLDAIFDIGLYWALFAGFALLVFFPSVGVWVTIASAALIVLTHGRSEKNIVMKLMKGLLGLYDLISYVSDLLSYSRILALGLAAGVIAQVVNILGTMGGPTVVGFIGFVIAFLLGHVLNMALNVLGTFVHTSRLHYIEFFNKFYEDGGRPFEPSLPSDKYTNE